MQIMNIISLVMVVVVMTVVFYPTVEGLFIHKSNAGPKCDNTDVAVRGCLWLASKGPHNGTSIVKEVGGERI